jgi:hypothetical protein
MPLMPEGENGRVDLKTPASKVSELNDNGMPSMALKSPEIEAKSKK